VTHLSMDTLLALREPGSEPGVAVAREHLDQCPQCQQELDRLHQRVARLKALPSLRPSRDRWPETAARLRTERRRRRTRTFSLVGLATAASVAIALATGRPSAPSSPLAERTAQELQRVMVRSQALESALSELNPDNGMVDGRTAQMAQELEDRIARVDRALEATELSPQQTDDQDVLKLWRERVGLLDALVDVHVTRASDAGL
jgi:DNA repair exonuclease SbcCD ATPase subunit